MHFAAAELADYAALFPQAGRRMWKAARVQILAGPAWTLWHAGDRLAIGGLYPLAGGVLEAWLMLPRDRKPGLAALHFLLDQALAVMPDRTVIARIHDSNRAGQRLAILAGFDPVAEWLPGTKIRTWRRPALVQRS